MYWSEKTTGLGKGKKVIEAAILYSLVRVPQRNGASFVQSPEGMEGVSYGVSRKEFFPYGGTV